MTSFSNFGALVLLLKFVAPIITQISTECDYDYYWRDYLGHVPSDAISGGTDENGQPFYIGQGYVDRLDLLTMTIFPGLNKAISSAYHRVVNISADRIKILCGPKTKNFVWVSTNSSRMAALFRSKYIIPGGQESTDILFIGRTKLPRGQILGKVFPDGHTKQGMWIPVIRNNSEEQLLDYEVLTYQCLDQCTGPNCPTKAQCQNDYYWSDYRGFIPEDAFEGGVNKIYGKFYVGQAYFHGNGLLTASIYPLLGKAISCAYGFTLETSENVKILRGKKDNFVWKTTRSGALDSLIKSSHVIPGGTEAGLQLYVGRIQSEAHGDVLGKVFNDTQGNKGLWVPTKNSATLKGHHSDFQVLTYDCKSNL